MASRRIVKSWAGHGVRWVFVVEKRFLCFWIHEETFYTLENAKRYIEEAGNLILWESDK